MKKSIKVEYIYHISYENLLCSKNIVEKDTVFNIFLWTGYLTVDSE